MKLSGRVGTRNLDSAIPWCIRVGVNMRWLPAECGRGGRRYVINIFERSEQRLRGTRVGDVCAKCSIAHYRLG